MLFDDDDAASDALCDVLVPSHFLNFGFVLPVIARSCGRETTSATFSRSPLN